MPMILVLEQIYRMCVKSFDPIFHLILGKSKLRVEWIHV